MTALDLRAQFHARYGGTASIPTLGADDFIKRIRRKTGELVRFGNVGHADPDGTVRLSSVVEIAFLLGQPLDGFKLRATIGFQIGLAAHESVSCYFRVELGKEVSETLGIFGIRAEDRRNIAVASNELP